MSGIIPPRVACFRDISACAVCTNTVSATSIFVQPGGTLTLGTAEDPAALVAFGEQTFSGDVAVGTPGAPATLLVNGLSVTPQNIVVSQGGALTEQQTSSGSVITVTVGGVQIALPGLTSYPDGYATTLTFINISGAAVTIVAVGGDVFVETSSEPPLSAALTASPTCLRSGLTATPTCLRSEPTCARAQLHATTQLYAAQMAAPLRAGPQAFASSYVLDAGSSAALRGVLNGGVGTWYVNAGRGATGPTGAPGELGPTGGVGTGPPGPTGPTGVQGASGLGLRGPTGPSGSTGPRGPTGFGLGPTGPTGANGTAGSSGLNGATGPTGRIGPTGPAGSGGGGTTGATGPSGPAGPAGPAGGAAGTPIQLTAAGLTLTAAQSGSIILGNMQVINRAASVFVTLPAPAASLTFSFSIQGLTNDGLLFPLVVSTNGGFIKGMSLHGISNSQIYLNTSSVSAPICTSNKTYSWDSAGPPSFALLPVTCEGNATMTLVCDGTNWDITGTAVNFGDQTLATSLSPVCLNFNAPRRCIYLGYADITAAPSATSIDAQVIAAVNQGYNVIIMFLIYPHLGTNPPPDPYSAAYYWAALPAATKMSVVGFAHSRGAVVMVSAGGATFGNTSGDYTVGGGTAFGTNCANWAASNYLDGVDLDFENFSAPDMRANGLTGAQAVQYCIDASNAVKSANPQLIVTHAPQSPYMGPGADVALTVPGYSNKPGGVLAGTTSIDWLNIQFYNQGPNSSQTYQLQFINSGAVHPNQAIAQINSNGGVPFNQIVLGKNLIPADGSADTYTSPQELGLWTQLAATRTGSGSTQGIGWHTGMSYFQWHQAYGEAGIRGAWPS